jgi:hypothetical protein
MKFEIDFGNPATGKMRTITVALTATEIAEVSRFRTKGGADPEIVARAMALRHAYKKVPEGFRHMRDGIRRELVH